MSPTPNRWFAPAELAVLTNPAAWRVVSSLAPPDAAPLRVPPMAYVHWRATHPDRHSQPEVLVALRGTTVQGLGDAVYRCSPGTVFFVAPHQRHDLNYPPTSPPVTHLWVGLHPNAVHARVLHVNQGRIRVGANFTVAPAALAVDWAELVARGRQTPEPACARLYLLAALTALAGALVAAGYAEPAADERARMQADVLAAIRRQLDETAGAGTSLESLARLAGYSKFHFLRLFKAHTGHTVHAYIDRCRQRRVKAWQAQGWTCKAMGQELGFSCPAAFSRWRRSRGA